MATRLRIQDQHQFMGISYCRDSDSSDNINDNQFPGDKGSACESCEEFENGIIKYLNSIYGLWSFTFFHKSLLNASASVMAPSLLFVNLSVKFPL